MIANSNLTRLSTAFPVGTALLEVDNITCRAQGLECKNEEKKSKREKDGKTKRERGGGKAR